VADRLQMVTRLGVLAEDAAQRGDDRAAEDLRRVAEHLMEVHGELLKLEDKRRRDRERKPRVPRKSTESTENMESAEIPVPPYVSPHTLSKESQHDAREAAAIEKVRDEAVERLIVTLTRQMGGLWPDADAFLKRRRYSTWEGWLREMSSSIGGGSQFTPEDLAQVCRDDAALDRPIGSPKGLRIFLGSARSERLNPEPPSAPRRGSTPAQRTAINGAEALKDIA
jgi:hypothetical protein